MVVIGEKELEEGLVSVRKQGEGDQGTMPVEQFAEAIQREIKELLSV
jgi:threonyl-tRNA synthetase